MMPEHVTNDSGHIQQLGRFRSDIRKSVYARMIVQQIAQRWGRLVHADFQDLQEKAMAHLTTVGNSPT